jgi:hypothetical protein
MSSASIALIAALAAGFGACLLLSCVPWFRRMPLSERLRPFHPRSTARPRRGLSVTSFQDVIGPLASRWGVWLGRIVGLRDDVGTRLARVGSPLDVIEFRVRQLGWSIVAFAVGALIATGLAMPAVVGLAFVLGAPVLVSLIVEQRLATASTAYQRRVFLELPVVAEQLGILLGAGYSLGAALGRLADRGSGVIARDLGLVRNRVHQGLSIDAALTEWADLADVDELSRIVQVLSLHHAATDLGPLISAEARSIRAEAHRRLIARMEQRAQLVWVPVTVAALLPGAIFLAVPFADAMRLVTG